jgi:hypothetical protein
VYDDQRNEDGEVDSGHCQSDSHWSKGERVSKHHGSADDGIAILRVGMGWPPITAGRSQDSMKSRIERNFE